MSEYDHNPFNIPIEIPSELIEWAKYLAIDPEGSIFVFGTEPVFDEESDSWLPYEDDDSYFEKIGEVDPPPTWCRSFFMRITDVRQQTVSQHSVH